MIINSTPQNEAVLSNVGQIGEFRIRNSAKAFSILSSGLYANKICAIIRELSCNAVDSHVAAGKPGAPFDVHLPNVLEPWFSIRDYGTGLTNDQVTNIYTTYFESTKTASNEFIGALGLGSKSPFSYTDNFTVTAIKDGKRGIYSAFINEQGVPSIALMYSEETTEPNGVEVKFSVNDRSDIWSFAQEAQQVYRYFKLRPNVTGSDSFKFVNNIYDTENISPGIHAVQGSRQSVAVMGNIGYPINIPNSDDTIGPLRNLLQCGLEIHFDIGELDFQASREGLSYIPQTIEAIKKKLEILNDRLADHIKEEAEKIDNLWLRAVYLVERRENQLWQAAVVQYVTDTKFPLVVNNRNFYLRTKTFELPVSELAKKYNIVVRGFGKGRHDRQCWSAKVSNMHSLDSSGKSITVPTWEIAVAKDTWFVINDGKIGALERAKHHWREQKITATTPYQETVYIIERADKTKPADTAAFFTAIANPPEDHIINADQLIEKPRKESGVGKNVTILRLERRGGSGYRQSDNDLVWREAVGGLNGFDSTTKYYYVPISGFSAVNTKCASVKDLYHDMINSGISTLANIVVYGVRKTDIEAIKKKKNWILLEDYLPKVLKDIDAAVFTSAALENFKSYCSMEYTPAIVSRVTDPDSAYLKLANRFKGFVSSQYNKTKLEKLFRIYGNNANVDVSQLQADLKAEYDEFTDTYPLLKLVYEHHQKSNPVIIADYINLADAAKSSKKQITQITV